MLTFAYLSCTINLNLILEYTHGDTVYVIKQLEQLEHIVTEIKILPGNGIKYLCSDGQGAEYFYGFELSSELNPDMLLKLKELE